MMKLKNLGLLDAVISIGIAINFVYFNDTTISFFSTSFTLPNVVYVILGAILVWASINVTNCSDGVDGLCGSLSIATIFLFNLLGSTYHAFNIIIIMTLLAYLWFNASPSKLLMGDAGSRAPIHEHSRKNKGWSDTQVVMRFVILQLFIGIVAVYLINQF